MAISKQKKKEVIERVANIVKNSQSVVFINFHGFSVENANMVRRELRKKGIGYAVAKKRLVKRVLDESKIQGIMPQLSGELALAYANDPILPAREIITFQKKLKDAIVSLGGIMEMRYITSEEVKVLAAIPGREVLYGQFVTVVRSPIQGTVSALGNIIRSFVVSLDQIAQKKM